MSNVSLIKVDKAEGGGRGRKGREKIWRSKGQTGMKHKKEGVSFSFVSFLPLSQHVFTSLSIYLLPSYHA